MIPEIISIRDEIAAGRAVPGVPVRTLLQWFGAKRRGFWVVREINEQLTEASLETEPNFESAWIDAVVGFSRLKSGQTSLPSSEPAEQASPGASEQTTKSQTTWITGDHTYRVSKLEAANQKIVSTPPDAPISEVITLLMAGGFSQLPVMTNPRIVRGMISWKSIGSRLALGNAGTHARHFMEPHHEIRADTSIFDAIPLIVANDYVLVRASDETISGIITANDLSNQFKLLTEPFLLLSEIENLVRNMIGDKFSVEELGAARDPSATEREIASVADLTFGEYIRLLQDPARWNQLLIAIDRGIFCDRLDKVRGIRNDVMHFDPDGITNEDVQSLRDFATFLKQLAVISRPTKA
jgi:predicted transcriptional regulator